MPGFQFCRSRPLRATQKQKMPLVSYQPTKAPEKREKPEEAPCRLPGEPGTLGRRDIRKAGAE